MKHNKNRSFENTHGFTLIELLAVIVVLAIVALIAFQAVLPLMGDARRNAFAIEVNNAVDSTTTWFMRKALISGTEIPTGTSKCISIDTLIEAGVYDADKDTYEGWVEISKNAKGAYLYKISMTNGTYYVSNAGVKDETNVNIQGSDTTVVKEGSAIGTMPTATDCPRLENN